MLKKTFLWRSAAFFLLGIPASAQSPLGELFASDPGAPSVAQPAGAGMTVLPGSELSAGIAPAILKLSRGGQVRICPHSQLSVNGGAEGLMLSASAGAFEISYQVDQSVTDLIVTPDFNIRLAGPNEYHFALGISVHGDTCFKPLPGNSAGIVFSESLGSDMYGVAPDEAAFFPQGKLAGRTALSRACGCPLAIPAMPASQAEAPSRPGEVPSAEHVLVANREPRPALPPDQPGQTHVEVETPLVFSARTAALPGAVAKIEFSALPNTFLVQDEADPVVLSLKPQEPPSLKDVKPEPAPVPKNEKKGFLARVKSFFGSIFHH